MNDKTQRNQRHPDATLRERTTSGQPLPHDSAHLHVTGQAVYVDDTPHCPGELACALALSQQACGILVKVNVDAALALPGVVRVITADDVPGTTEIGPVFPGDPVLANGRVEFIGQPVAAVVAFDERTARRAARLISADVEPESAILDIDTAMARRSFVTPPHTITRGDPQSAMAAATHQLEGTCSSGAQDHFYLEGQISLAVPKENGELLVLSSTQNPTETQKLVADVIGVAMHAVTVETRRMGGGFGGKETQNAQGACIAALAARLTGCPARLRLPRSEDMVTTGKRHRFTTRWQVGFDASGRIEALEAHLAADCGFSPDLSAAIVDRAVFHTDNAYFLADVSVTGYPCKTNTVSNTAFRGFGGPQGMFVIENIIDSIARHLGISTLEIRRTNFYSGGRRATTHYGQSVDHEIGSRILEELAVSSDYASRRKEIDQHNATSPPIIRGLSITPVKFGISFTARHLNQAGALIHIYHDGSVHLNHGGTEMGQGLFVKVAQIVAEELQVGVDRIGISATRTDKVPNTSPTAASAGADLNGMAALLAARELKDRLYEFATRSFSVPRNAIVFRDGHVHVGETTLTFNELVHRAYMDRVNLSATGHYETPDIWYDRDKGEGEPFFYFSWGAAVSEVEIDRLTGETKVTRADLLHDVGNSLNPAIDIGQIEGGYVQGLGWLTTEEIVFDDTGRLQTRGPATYKIPAVGDPPADLRIHLTPDTPNHQPTVYRSKAVGEPPLMLAISAFLAVKDAISSISGYAVDPKLDAPATPERILSAIDRIS